MRTRLIGAAVLVALVAVLALGVPLGVVASNRVRDDAQNRLQREADGIALLAEEAVEGQRTVQLSRVALIAGEHNVEITLPDGRTVRTATALTGPTLRATAPIATGGSVQVTASASEAQHDATEAWIVVGLLGLGALVAAAALGLWQARRLATPLEELAEASENLGHAGFVASPASRSVPEVDALARALERRAEQIVELLAQERAFSSNVAHQLRSPLTGLSMRLEELAASDVPATRAEAEAALAQADRLGRTIDNLLALSQHGSPGDVREIDLTALLQDRVRAWQPIYRRARRTLAVDAPGTTVFARAASGAVEQALDVLIENALQHGEGRVVLEAHLTGNHAAITVADDGHGITDAEQPTLFQGKPRHGGLGLPLARTVIERCGGRLLLTSSTPPVFEIRLISANRDRRGREGGPP